MVGIPNGTRAINSVGECHPHTVEVTGSSPVSPTIYGALTTRWWGLCVCVVTQTMGRDAEF